MAFANWSMVKLIDLNRILFVELLKNIDFSYFVAVFVTNP